MVGLGAFATGVALAVESRQGLAETAVPPVPGVVAAVVVAPWPPVRRAVGVAAVAPVPLAVVAAAVVPEPLVATAVVAAAAVVAEPAGVFKMGAEVAPSAGALVVAAGTAVGLSPQASKVMHSSKATSARPVYLNFKIDNA